MRTLFALGKRSVCAAIIRAPRIILVYCNATTQNQWLIRNLALFVVFLEVPIIVFSGAMATAQIVNAHATSEDLWGQVTDLYHQAMSAPPDVRPELYVEIRENLDRIVADFPASNLATHILLQDELDGIDLAQFEQNLLSGAIAPTARVVTPEAAPDAQVVEEAKPATAPEEAGTELATEANKAEPLAPSASARPKARTARRAETAPAETQETPATTDATQAVIDAAVAAAPGPTSTPAPASAMTAGEKDGFRAAVQACWNVGSLSSEALSVTVTVAFVLGQEGKPDAGSIIMTEYEGGSDGAARQAFEAARRAVILCGANGYQLPPEKYDQWRIQELVFAPERMRIK